MTPVDIAKGVGRLRSIPFFPGDPEVGAQVAELLTDMVHTAEQLEWLTRRAMNTWTRWDGAAALRALYCSRWPARDGVDPMHPDEDRRITLPALIGADVYQRACLRRPSEIAPPMPEIEAPRRLLLTAGESEVVTADPEQQAAIVALGEKRDLNTAKPFTFTERDLEFRKILESIQ